MSNIAEIEQKIFNAINPDLDKWGLYYTGVHVESEHPYILMADDVKEIITNKLKFFYGFDNIDWVPAQVIESDLVAKARILQDNEQGKYKGKTGYLYSIMFTPPVLPKPNLDLLEENEISISKPYMDVFTTTQEDARINSYRNMIFRWKTNGATIDEAEIAEVLKVVEDALRNHKQYEPNATAKPMFIMAVA